LLPVVTTWTPLLTGERREAALAAAQAIAGELAGDAARLLPAETSDRDRRNNASLGYGRAGLALALGYLTAAGFDYGDAARELIADASAMVSGSVMGPALFTGFGGIAWALQQLGDWDVAAPANGGLQMIDRAVAQFLDRDSWPWHFELGGGLAGFLVYALSRLPSADAERAVVSIVRLLEARAVALPSGISWFVEPSLLHGETLDNAPRGYYSPGIAHGNAGVIAVLAEVLRAGIEPARVRPLIEGGVDWMLSTRIDGTWNFPTLIGQQVRSKPARVSWCYGAPGIAHALLRAADACGRDDWRETALRIALWAAEQPLERSGVTDAELCHGSAGLGHIFHRMYRATDDERLAEAARRWYDHAIRVRVDGRGIGGYLMNSPTEEDRDIWDATPALVFGSAGVAASLVAACSEVEPRWDAMFLLSDARRG
jgi:lantibiotic biosynthesis protein